MITLALTLAEARALNHLALLGAAVEMLTDDEVAGPLRHTADRIVMGKLTDVRGIPPGVKIAVATKMAAMLQETLNQGGAA